MPAHQCSEGVQADPKSIQQKEGVFNGELKRDAKPSWKFWATWNNHESLVIDKNADLKEWKQKQDWGLNEDRQREVGSGRLYSREKDLKIEKRRALWNKKRGSSVIICFKYKNISTYTLRLGLKWLHLNMSFLGVGQPQHTQKPTHTCTHTHNHSTPNYCILSHDILTLRSYLT